MSDIGDVARAVEVIGKIIFSALHPSQQDQIKVAYEESFNRVADFRDSLLADNFTRCAILWDGSLPVIPVNISESQRAALEAVEVRGIDKYQWLGQFARAEGANFASKMTEIVQSTTPSDH